MATLMSTLSFLRIKAFKDLLNFRPRESLSCSCKAFLSSTNQELSDRQDASDLELSPEDYEVMLLENEEAAAMDELCNVSGLTPDQYRIQHGKPPSYTYKTLARRRKLYARYGSASGEDPRIMWPSKQDIVRMMNDDKLDEIPLHEKFATLQAERNAAEKERLDRCKMIEKNMAQMSKWISEYKARIQAAEDEVKVKQEKKEALLDEARSYFGYKIRANDPKFQQMIEEKEEQEKKDAKEKKKKEKARKAAERLKQDVILMGLTPEDDNKSS